eukprot:1295603-Prymnesium_polylepis.1
MASRPILRGPRLSLCPSCILSLPWLPGDTRMPPNLMSTMRSPPPLGRLTGFAVASTLRAPLVLKAVAVSQQARSTGMWVVAVDRAGIFSGPKLVFAGICSGTCDRCYPACERRREIVPKRRAVEHHDGCAADSISNCVAQQQRLVEHQDRTP